MLWHRSLKAVLYCRGVIKALQAAMTSVYRKQWQTVIIPEGKSPDMSLWACPFIEFHNIALWFNKGMGSEMGVAQLLALKVLSSTTLEF